MQSSSVRCALRKVDFAILVGEEMEILAETIQKQVETGIKVAHVPDAAAADQLLRNTIRNGDAVLVKGSNSVGLSVLIGSLVGDAPHSATG